MLRHIAAIGAGVALAAEHMQKYVFGRHSEGVCNRLLTVIREKPVMARLHQHDRADLNFFMATRRRMERHFSLTDEYFEPLFDVKNAEHFAMQLLYNGVWNDTLIHVCPWAGWRFY